MKLVSAINRICYINPGLAGEPSSGVELRLPFKLNYAHVSQPGFIESYGINHKQTLKTWLR